MIFERTCAKPGAILTTPFSLPEGNIMRHNTDRTAVLVITLACTILLCLLFGASLWLAPQIQTGTQTLTAAPIGQQSVLSDNFNSILNLNSWPRGTYKSERAEGTRTFMNGVYRWEVKALQGVTWLSGPSHDPVSDFQLSVDVKHVRWFVNCCVISRSRVSGRALLGHFHFLKLQAANHGIEH